MQRSNQSEALACLAESLQRAIQFVARMRSSHDGPHARFAFRHRRESDSRGQNPFLEQGSRKLMGAFRLAGHYRRDRSLAAASIEACGREALFEVARIVPQVLDALRLLLEHVEGGQAGRSYRR